MQDRTERVYSIMPQVGCLLALGAVCMMCVLSWLFVDVMQAALRKLHLSPEMASLALVGIFFGGLINIPLYRLQHEEEQLAMRGSLYGAMGWIPVVQRHATETIVAVNVGGCVIPVLLALYLLTHILDGDARVKLALLVAGGVNILVCYRVARPVPGVGIAMPGLISPLIAVGLSWLLLASPQYELLRAPVAFVAGMLGPLVGADLLHYRDFGKISASVVSLGGAGTFDGIVLSGILAALLA